MKKQNNAFIILYRGFLQVITISPLSGILSLIYKVIEGLFPAYITAISARLFDAVGSYIEGSSDISHVKWLSLLLLLGYGVKQIFLYISSITVNAGVYEKVVNNSKGYLYKKCSEIPLIEYEKAETMDRKNRASECVNREVISQLYMMNITLIMSTISIVSIVAVLSTYSLLFIPISILSVIPYFIVRLIRGKEFYELKKQQVKKERRRDYLWSLFTNKQSIKEMRIMNFGDYISNKWQKVRDEVNDETWKLTKKDSASLLICDFIRILGYALCILVSFILVINNMITVGVFSACIGAFSSVQGQTKSFLIELGNIPEKINYARDYFQFIDSTENDYFYRDNRDKINSIKKIEFKNITFIYPNAENKAINNLNLKINAGEKIALVGENGSGKTTFTKILLGLYRPASGMIQINGCDVLHFNKTDYLNKLSMISQNFVQYHMMLRENVAISNISSVSDDNSIMHALHAADFTFDEPNMNLDSLLGREFGGYEFSGGQWQKLAIARGIFRECELIVMDEPTSAIDPISETAILKKFLEIAHDKTAIIVSHRTGLCTLVDKIAVMKDGQIVEFGSHKDLLKEDGEYARLFNAQRQWYL
jgi:ABC superfamily ATP binding cassette transporter, membrane protein